MHKYLVIFIIGGFFMPVNKIKINSLIIMLIILFTFFMPVISYAIDKDSIYVWSNNNPLPTTASLQSSNIEETSESQNSRKFFRNNFWKRNSNGSKNRKNFVRI